MGHLISSNSITEISNINGITSSSFPAALIDEDGITSEIGQAIRNIYRSDEQPLILTAVNAVRRVNRRDQINVHSGNRQRIMAAVVRNGWAIAFMNARFLNDWEILRTALGQDSRTIILLTARLANHRTGLINFITALILHRVISPASFRFLPAVLLRNENVLSAMIETNYSFTASSVAQLMPDQDFQRAWYNLNFSAFSSLPNPPADVRTRHTTLLQRFMSLNSPIRHAERLRRMSYREAEELISNRENNTPDGRPLAVILFARDDWNGFLANNSHRYAELIRRGFRVMLYEISDEGQLLAAIRICGRRQPINYLEVAAHGNFDNTFFYGDGSLCHDEFSFGERVWRELIRLEIIDQYGYIQENYLEKFSRFTWLTNSDRGRLLNLLRRSYHANAQGRMLFNDYQRLRNMRLDRYLAADAFIGLFGCEAGSRMMPGGNNVVDYYVSIFRRVVCAASGRIINAETIFSGRRVTGLLYTCFEEASGSGKTECSSYYSPPGVNINEWLRPGFLHH